MKPSLKQLETFVCVADMGSFRRAADRLNTTQPNVSSRIAGLENVIGISLMERDAGSVRLTKRGKELLEYARQVLFSVDEFMGATENVGLFDGVLRLGVTEMIVNSWLPLFLASLKKRFPAVVVDLTVDLSAHLETELENSNIDLALQSGPFQLSASIALELGSVPMVWVASKELKDDFSTEIDVAQMARFPIIAHAKNTKHFGEIKQHFSACKSPSVQIMQCNNLAAAVQMVVDGFGVAPMLAPMVENEISIGKLIKVDYAWRPSDLDFFARYNDRAATKVVTQAALIAGEIGQNFARRYRP